MITLHQGIILLFTFYIILTVSDQGVLANGTEIAVKRLSKNSEKGLQVLKTGIQLTARFQHQSTFKQKEKLPVYEFMHNNLEPLYFASCLNS